MQNEICKICFAKIKNKIILKHYGVIICEYCKNACQKKESILNRLKNDKKNEKR